MIHVNITAKSEHLMQQLGCFLPCFDKSIYMFYPAQCIFPIRDADLKLSLQAEMKPRVGKDG